MRPKGKARVASRVNRGGTTRHEVFERVSSGPGGCGARGGGSGGGGGGGVRRVVGHPVRGELARCAWGRANVERVGSGAPACSAVQGWCCRDHLVRGGCSLVDLGQVAGWFRFLVIRGFAGKTGTSSGHSSSEALAASAVGDVGTECECAGRDRRRIAAGPTDTTDPSSNMDPSRGIGGGVSPACPPRPLALEGGWKSVHGLRVSARGD